MCGISLLINNTPEGSSSIQKMMRANHHRGPDASGFEQVAERVWLAANRLKILDLTSFANQPLWNEEKSCVLAWNGAIYNYKTLGDQLNFDDFSQEANSDSAVLLAWLTKYGGSGINDLKGMFALVFINLHEGKIIIARDISGEKPLYYINEKQKWAFSSEARAVRLSQIESPTIDTHQFTNFFYTRHSAPDQSFFQGIKQLLPGQIISIDLNGNLLDTSVITKNTTPSKTFTQTRFESILKDSIRKTFHSDRPVGMLLSGGADSSLVYSMYLEEKQSPCHTYTATFDSKYHQKYSDPNFSKQIVSKDDRLHHEIYVDPKIIKDSWNEYIKSLDQPVGDSASILSWIIAKEAKKHVSVLVSGAGADELFGGYQRHAAFLKYMKYHSLLLCFQPILKKIPLPDPISKLVQGIQASPRDSFLNFAALSKLPESVIHQQRKWYPDSGDTYKDALSFDRNYYLVNDVLKIHDNACMAHGIEGRSPFLYKELIELITQLSEKELIQISGKKPIKSALVERGWKSIAHRKKFGFGLPLQEWLADDEVFRNWIFEEIKMMANTWGKYFPLEMKNFCQHPDRARGREFLLIWNMFILASWLKTHA
ncbi:asparagine synthase (glutamine-hydrolyzing) [Belliella sp. DSM 111904]|uniref:asparagine synthase (glutamine-hydrolyzing) n=1 Tax=Belliella filtrata TaxID=2923435 RepID=A0ABS9UUZ7_9BACT|nr:asparagine synthase (glutamine-hydrolyzing) [Belliella filtrata]MCH7407988.1 asparagine synthase (glutamine-hydrolyzing) [Belliella filtrata]